MKKLKLGASTRKPRVRHLINQPARFRVTQRELKGLLDLEADYRRASDLHLEAITDIRGRVFSGARVEVGPLTLAFTGAIRVTTAKKASRVAEHSTLPRAKGSKLLITQEEVARYRDLAYASRSAAEKWGVKLREIEQRLLLGARVEEGRYVVTFFGGTVALSVDELKPCDPTDYFWKCGTFRDQV